MKIEKKFKNNLTSFKENQYLINLNNQSQIKDNSELMHKFHLDFGFNGIRSVNVTYDNRYLIITFENNQGLIRIVDLTKLEILPHDYEGHTDSVRLTSITKDSKAFYTASWDGTCLRFDIATGQCSQILCRVGKSPSCFLDPTQNYLFTASYEAELDLESNNRGRCWNLLSGDLINTYKHTNYRTMPAAIDIASEDGIVYTGSDDGIAYKWKINEEKPIMKFFEFKGSVRKIAVSANFFAAACTDGLVRLHNKYSGKGIKYFKHNADDIRDVRISKDETKLWSADENGSVSCFNIITGKLIYRRPVHSYWIWSICLMNDEKILVTGSSDGTAAFLSSDTGEVLAKLLNAHRRNEILITCPPDKTYPNGFFYTNNKDCIEVFRCNKKIFQKKLDLTDPKRETYINRLNLKNLVLTRLKSNGHYTSLTEQYFLNKKTLLQTRNQNLLRLLMN